MGALGGNKGAESIEFGAVVAVVAFGVAMIVSYTLDMYGMIDALALVGHGISLLALGVPIAVIAFEAISVEISTDDRLLVGRAKSNF